MIVMHAAGFAAIVVAWLKGGHTERFGVVVLVTAYMFSIHTYTWRIGDVYWAAAAQDLIAAIVFGGLALRTSRWWPLVMTALFALVMLVHLLTIVDSDLSEFAAMSALVGLNTLINATLLASAFERWLAGEKPVSRIGRNMARKTMQAGEAAIAPGSR